MKKLYELVTETFNKEVNEANQEELRDIALNALTEILSNSTRNANSVFTEIERAYTKNSSISPMKFKMILNNHRINLSEVEDKSLVKNLMPYLKTL